MTFKLRVQMLVDPNHEISNGVYLDRTIMLPDRLWEMTLKEVKSLITDSVEYEL